MNFQVTIPTPTGAAMQFNILQGSCLFVLGANGTGKSSLMHLIYSSHSRNAHRISAHRQTWLSSGTANLSPEQKRLTETQLTKIDVQPQARWKDDYSGSRPSMAISDLLDAENVRARLIATAVDNGDFTTAKTLSANESPMRAINELLRLSNIPIEISVHQNDQVLASRRGSPHYSIAELSDGERNALLLAADVLTAPPGTLLVIDEPERHLHRAIISPLLSLLFAKKSDCAFVVSTHDVGLPADNPTSQTLLLRGCTYVNSKVQSWDADLIPSTNDIDELIKRDILGSRRRILFVEGKPQSLDTPLFALLFPDVSVVPKESCREVIQSTLGIRGASSLHYVQAFGLIDNDRRVAEDIAKLATQGIFALEDYSVESIYYHFGIRDRVAARHAAVTGHAHSQLMEQACQSALSVIEPHIPRLAERAIERAVRYELEKQLPTRAQIANGVQISISLDTKTAVQAEIAQLRALHSAGNFEAILKRYPVRETPALSEVAKRLGFQNRGQYEDSVRKLLMDDNAALQFAKSLFGSLASALTNEAVQVTA